MKMHNEMEKYKKMFDRVCVSESTRMEVLKQMANYEEKKRAVRIPKRLIIAIAVIAALTLTIAAYTAIELHGFAYSGDFSEDQIAQALDDASHAKGATLIDANGNVQIMDQYGNVVSEMTESEYYANEREQLRKMEEEAQAMTDLVDLSTLELSPWGVEEIAVTNGTFPDFLLSNGYMVVLSDADGEAFDLKAGQTVTIGMTANDSCYVVAGIYRDGALLEEAPTASTVEHAYTFEIPEDGSYCFSLMYASAAASSFTGCSLTIQ